MLKPEKYKPQRKFGWDFSPGQHIAAICVFLLQALVMFCLGVAVGKYQPSSFYAQEKNAPAFGASQNQQEGAARWNGALKRPGSNDPAGPRVSELPAPKSAVSSARPPQQVAKAPEVKPPTPPAAPPAGDAATPAPAPAPAPAEKGTPTPPAIPPNGGALPAAPGVPVEKGAGSPAVKPPAGGELLPLPGEKAEVKVKPPIDESPAAALAPLDKPAPAAQAAAPSADKAAAPVDKAGTAAPTAPAVAATDKAGTRPTTGDAKPGSGKYVIQVASFSGADKRKKADICKSRLDRNAGMKAEILGADTDEYLRVVVGNFGDKESAQKECAELRTRSDFAQCFVRQR